MNQIQESGPIGADSLASARRVQRRRTLRLVLAFVVLPTLVVAIYTGFVQTRFYESFALVAVEPGTAGAPIDARADAMLLRDYARSRDGFAVLTTRAHYREHFGASWVDFRSRLGKGATNEAAYEHFQRFSNIEIDPETGFVLIRIRAHSGRKAKELTTTVVAAMAERAALLAGGDAANPGRRLTIVASPSLPDAAAGPNPLRAILTAFFGSITLLVIATMVVSTAMEHADV